MGGEQAQGDTAGEGKHRAPRGYRVWWADVESLRLWLRGRTSQPHILTPGRGSALSLASSGQAEQLWPH